MVGEYGPGSCRISKTKKTPFERNHVPLPMKYIEKKVEPKTCPGILLIHCTF